MVPFQRRKASANQKLVEECNRELSIWQQNKKKKKRHSGDGGATGEYRKSGVLWCVGLGLANEGF